MFDVSCCASADLLPDQKCTLQVYMSSVKVSTHFDLRLFYFMQGLDVKSLYTLSLIFPVIVDSHLTQNQKIIDLTVTVEQT